MSTWNANTVARSCRAGLAALTLVILSASLAEAEYGPRTTIGNNYQQTSSTWSRDPIESVSCTAGSRCHVLFQPVPQQNPLIVQHVSCRVGVSTGGLRYRVLLTRKGQDLLFRSTYLAPVTAVDGAFWIVNSPVMHLLKSGERPVVRFENSAQASWGMECSISGTLQQP